MQLTVNGTVHALDDVEPDTPLLWVLRDELGLTGTKYGCGIAVCGACTVHVDGRPRRACVLPLGAVDGEVTTIEGLAARASGGDAAGDAAAGGETRDGGPSDPSDRGASGRRLSPLQAIWRDEQVAQCGYCQSGQIMSAAALLAEIPDPSEADIDRAMAGNLCRCGTYPRVRAAIREAAARRARS